MKGFLIILFLMLALQHTALGQTEKCMRVETHLIKVDVSWCAAPAVVELSTSYGYCANAQCKSQHEIHITPEITKEGK